MSLLASSVPVELDVSRFCCVFVVTFQEIPGGPRGRAFRLRGSGFTALTSALRLPVATGRRRRYNGCHGASSGSGATSGALQWPASTLLSSSCRRPARYRGASWPHARRTTPALPLARHRRSTTSAANCSPSCVGIALSPVTRPTQVHALQPARRVRAAGECSRGRWSRRRRGRRAQIDGVAEWECASACRTAGSISELGREFEPSVLKRAVAAQVDVAVRDAAVVLFRSTPRRA